MSRALLFAPLVWGCLDAPPINQRPSLDILRLSGDAVFRGDRVDLRAVAVDPDRHLVHFQWRAYGCTDASAGSCDRAPFHTSVLEQASFIVPSARSDEAVPVRQVLVLLEGEDDYGATAKPIQQLLITIDDHPPDLALRAYSSYGAVVDTPIDIAAKVGDRDDGAASTLPLQWRVYTPMNQPTYDLDDIDIPEDPADPAHLQLGKRLTPHGIGSWEIEVKAVDPLGAETVQRLMIEVAADRAPCLSQWAPIAAPAGAALPLTEPTLFQVHVVADDLDVFPPQPGDAVMGTTTFSWSVLPPNATARQPLSTTTNRVTLDPASYAPGDIVELRVEIYDRKATPITCAEASATCSVISDNACIQRLTWRAEVR